MFEVFVCLALWVMVGSWALSILDPIDPRRRWATFLGGPVSWAIVIGLALFDWVHNG